MTAKPSPVLLTPLQQPRSPTPGIYTAAAPRWDRGRGFGWVISAEIHRPPQKKRKKRLSARSRPPPRIPPRRRRLSSLPARSSGRCLRLLPPAASNPCALPLLPISSLLHSLPPFVSTTPLPVVSLFAPLSLSFLPLPSGFPTLSNSE